MAAGETAQLLELEVWNPCLSGVHKHEKERARAPADSGVIVVPERSYSCPMAGPAT